MLLTIFIVSFLVLFGMLSWKIVEEGSDKEFVVSQFVHKADEKTAFYFKKVKRFFYVVEQTIKFLVLYKLPSIGWRWFVRIKKSMDRKYNELVHFIRGRHSLKGDGVVSSYLKSVSEYRNEVINKEEEKKDL